MREIPHLSMKKLLSLEIAVFLAGVFFSIAILQIGAVLLFLTAFRIYYLKLREKQHEFLDALALFYVLSGLLAVLFSPRPEYSMPAFMKSIIIATLIPALFFVRWDNRLSLTRFAAAVTLLATAASLAGFVHFFQGYERTAGFYGGYYTLAAMMVFTLPLGIGLIVDTQGYSRFLLIGAVVLQLAALWWTYTRSAFLALCVALAVGMLVLISRHRELFSLNVIARLAGLMAIPVILTLLVLSSPDPRINPFRHESEIKSENLDLTSGRSEIYQDAQRIIGSDFAHRAWKNILIGHGLRSRELLVNSQFRSWESDYLEVYMNQGILGLAILLGLYIALFLRVRIIFKMPPRGRKYFLVITLLVSTVGFWIMSFFTLQMQSISGSSLFVFLFMAWELAGQKDTPELLKQ